MNTSLRPTAIASSANSLSRNTVCVSLRKPPGIGLADWMSKLRDWLDQHGIEPVCFKYTDGSGYQLYEISFRDRTQADRFTAEFDNERLRQHTSAVVMQPADE